MRWPVGVVDVVYMAEPSVTRRSELARDDGFEFYDAMLDVDPTSLALPVGCPTAYPRPEPTWCATPAPSETQATWDETVERYRTAPGALLEPWAGATVNSIEKIAAFVDAVPGTRFLIDTGHVTAWGEDPLDALPFAAHVQLRDAREGLAQVEPGEGEVDFAAVLRRLGELRYDGGLAIEYFDLPTRGWPCADPVAAAVELASILRAL